MFTVKQIENLKAQDKTYLIREGRGFGVRVFPSGQKAWVFTYKFQGRQRMMTLGAYPDLKLKDAREIHRQKREMVAKGIDPLVAKAEAYLEPTVKEAISQYLERAEKRGMRSIYEERRCLNKYIPKGWLRRKVKTIKRGEVRALVEGLSDSAPQMANQLLKVLHRFFVFCVDREFTESNPCFRMASPAPIVKKDRWLSEQEIKNLLAGLPVAKMTAVVRRALQLILVTAQRPGEVVQIQHEQIEGRWWTIPSEISKNKLAHRVYLTDMALELIGEGEGYVFASPVKGKDYHLSRQTLSVALTHNDHFKLDHWTPHDLRRTAASHMTSMGIPRTDVSKVLNHSDSSVTAVYDRNSYDKEKQIALEAWERKLRAITTGETLGKVLPLHG